MSWWEGGIGATLADAAGRRTRIGGQPARLSFRNHAGCPVGADKAVVATIQPPDPFAGVELLWVTACLRGPDFAANEAAFGEMLSTLRFEPTQ